MQWLCRAGLLALPICATATAGAAVDLNFCWKGGGGYTMTGRMSVPDMAFAAGIVTETDVTGFKISGYRDGVPIGHWDMADRTAAATWHLRFDPTTMEFPTGDAFAGPASQGWNANGDVTDCGAVGFGFNAGNWAQDLCVNGAYVAESSIAPETPLVATTNPVTPDCGRGMVLSKSPKTNHRH